MNAVRLAAAGTLISAALFATSAYAGADSGFYLGAGVGQASVGDIDGVGDFDGEDTGYKLIAGYNFGLIPLLDLAVEAEYVDFGEPDDGGIKVDANAFAAFGLAGINLGPFGIFAKAGMFNWDADATGGFSDDGTDPAYGAGVRFQISSFQIRAEYEYFDADPASLDLLSASLLYTF